MEFPNISKNVFFFPGMKVGDRYNELYPMFWEHEEWVVYPYDNWDRVSVEE